MVSIHTLPYIRGQLAVARDSFNGLQWFLVVFYGFLWWMNRVAEASTPVTMSKWKQMKSARWALFPGTLGGWWHKIFNCSRCTMVRQIASPAFFFRVIMKAAAKHTAEYLLALWICRSVVVSRGFLKWAPLKCMWGKHLVLLSYCCPQESIIRPVRKVWSRASKVWAAPSSPFGWSGCSGWLQNLFILWGTWGDTQKYPNQPLFALFPVVLSPCYIVHPFFNLFHASPSFEGSVVFFTIPARSVTGWSFQFFRACLRNSFSAWVLLLERRVLHPYTVLFEEGEVGSTMVPWLILVDLGSSHWSRSHVFKRLELGPTSQVGSNMRQSSCIRWSSMWGRRDILFRGPPGEHVVGREILWWGPNDGSAAAIPCDHQDQDHESLSSILNVLLKKPFVHSRNLAGWSSWCFHGKSLGKTFCPSGT